MNNKKIIAAMSAVMNYIKTQEEIALHELSLQQLSPASLSAAVSLNLWGQSGRQAQMHIRNLMQTKTFHGLKHR